jgi:hypothetical protein
MSSADTMLEQWYWHTLYLNNWIEATKAQKKIRQTFDQCCDLSPLPVRNRYPVTFSTNYPFLSAHQQDLIGLVGSHVDFETVFNQPGEEVEGLFRGDRDTPKRWFWSTCPGCDDFACARRPEDASLPTCECQQERARRVRIVDNLCTLCNTRPRASYGLWCVACKRASKRPDTTDQVPDGESDLCPFCDMSFDRVPSRKVSLEKALIEMGLGFLAYLILVIFIGLIALPGLLAGMLAGIVLWFFEED